MQTINNVSRRKFLKALGISSSALVLSVNLPGLSLLPKVFAAEENPEKFIPNVYVEVNSNNIVSIIVHRSEMGQGIRTSIPMIVADELEADWQQIKVVQGLGDKKYGSQNTDGSRSIRNFYKPLREAGASARIMLEQAAAQLWKVPVGECKAIDGKIIHQKSQKSVGFGELVAIASTLPVPEPKDIVLKNKADFKFIGKSNVKLVDGQDIATGKAIYGFDVELENMVYVVIARPPVLASKVKSFDDSQAIKIKGVIKVIQLEDIKDPVGFKPLGGIAVIATNTWAAIKGREALKIEWDVSHHSSYNSSEYKAMLKESCDSPKKILRDKGDTTAALANASSILKAEYYVPELVHAPMEPPAATAHYHDGILEAWACTQTPQSAQGTVAKAVGLAPEKVFINVTLLGGGFGRKSKPDFVAEAAIISKQLALPVKVLWTREDEIQNGYYHAVSYHKLEAGFDQNSQVTSWLHKTALPPIGSTFNAKAKVINFEGSLGMIDMPYDIANIKCTAGKADAHTRIGWMRSVTNINQAFAVCSFADEIAHARKENPKQSLLTLLGSDRHINVNKEKAKYGNYGEKLKEYPIDTARLKQALNKVADMAEFTPVKENGNGMGIAVHRSFTSYVGCVVEVSKNPQGHVKIEKIWMSADCGTIVNPERVISQMEGAAVFGLSLTLFGEITAKDGVIEQSNFDSYRLVRMNEVPPIEVEILPSHEPPGGVGEPGVPPIAPAICNAIFAATGNRYRKLPLAQYNII
ncbi:molybdopterin cofactor-binding domain-containing protein [Pseudocolwellia sp. AS88]|uniref:xanthine dehydrogenase family protein molybdopterin-binding subunit n=1 Tax=Pseudocolwellia sp. AS88 TaxID=3063958 RepID=UPI0026F16F1D|nr:molybdopterin cofactor-binding domain-containing protein [Pseudocolwellia sp. AS88]MDO7085172.1 molybdopterin-dependent oxidoreductase [Pseudocolwellia sp. AS88]